ncbi:AhpC/TSA family protein [Pelagicoccus sp. SDUM812002]|uniref:AhpC/TSA family protein n=1 Tax=Pelagicoccus sp. SDUM812002 TaxID=3041266 RepID=UPI00280EAAE0|nr:AhpC/TSA family protein [Pelagicoccus sp. SDUM812002]MDQ8186018.1 redoxin domain-containing protein [Pelagicoccus sp. SDUM812002]
MSKLSVHSQVPFSHLISIEGENVEIPSKTHAFTHLQFRRFAGCPICDMHLQSFAAGASLLAENHIREVVFFHSSAEALLRYNSKLPFHVIADPDKTHYKSFGVESSLRSVLHPSAIWQGLRGVIQKGLGLSLKNGPLGLPADFLIDDSGVLVAVKYGVHAYDQWTVHEVLDHAKQTAPT